MNAGREVQKSASRRQLNATPRLQPNGDERDPNKKKSSLFRRMVRLHQFRVTASDGATCPSLAPDCQCVLWASTLWSLGRQHQPTSCPSVPGARLASPHLPFRQEPSSASLLVLRSSRSGPPDPGPVSRGRADLAGEPGAAALRGACRRCPSVCWTSSFWLQP